MSDKKLIRISALLAATQLAAGQATALSSATDFIFTENARMTTDIQTVQSAEATGTLDDNEGFEVTSIRGGFTFDVNLSGEGDAGSEPRYARLLQACGFQQQVTASPISATCQAGGSVTTVVLDSGASAVDDYYRGMPIEFSGDFTDYSFITAYDGATKTATVATELPQSPGAGTTYTIPKNVLYRPVSGEPAMLTMALYTDDQKKVFEGCRGNVVFNFEAAGLVKASFTFQGNYVNSLDEAAPVVSYSRHETIKFMAGRALLDRVKVAVSSISLNPQNSLTFDPNPNQEQGYDAAEITGRNMQCSLDPALTTVATRNALGNVQSGHEYVLHALAGRISSVGNRLGLTIPRGMTSGYDMADRQSIATEQLTLTCKGADAGAFIALY